MLGQLYQGKLFVMFDLFMVMQLFGMVIVMCCEVFEFDVNGVDIGCMIDGVVIVLFDSVQVVIVCFGCILWVQGGILIVLLNGQQIIYGYVVLCCVQDVVNGDNVEFVFFFKNQMYVFCYYYVVLLLLEFGMIVIWKQFVFGLFGQGMFCFDGNFLFVDMNVDGVNDFFFVLIVIVFVLQIFVCGVVGVGDFVWQVLEVLVGDGWQFVGLLVCISV